MAQWLQHTSETQRSKQDKIPCQFSSTETVMGHMEGRKNKRLCFVFISASQTELLTKWPIWATSFHSDWPNWDLLTASPIRAGTGQSAAGICHPQHTGLPPRINALSVSATLMTFSFYERFNCLQNPLYRELNVKTVWPHIDIEFQMV